MIIPRTGMQGRLIFVTGEIGSLFSEKMLESRRMKKRGDVRPGFLSLKVKLEVKTDVDDETLKEWLRVVESRCPVSDNIKNETPVEIEVEKAP